MEMSSKKPMKTAEELVELLRDTKGVTFHLIDYTTAIDYLSHKNNYLRTASYRKNYDKYKQVSDPTKYGKYINLDFAYLVELSTIDFYLRNILLKMCIDIEHALKVMLVEKISHTSSEDGYSIVTDFINNNPYLRQNIASKSKAIFTKDLIEKYFDIGFDHAGKLFSFCCNCPVWVFMELIDFGTLSQFISYCSLRNAQLNLGLMPSVIRPIRSLRNACAHNNCLLASLHPSNVTTPPQIISKFVANMHDIPTVGRKKKLSCRPLFEIICLLYSYQEIISPSVYTARMSELKQFVNGRMLLHKDYFQSNLLISSTLEFLQKAVDNLPSSKV